MAMHFGVTARAAAVLVVAGALAGCVTPGGYGSGGYGQPGGYGQQGGYGQPDGYGQPGGYGAQSVGGAVEAFDPGSGRLRLASEGGYGRGVELQVDRNTRLFYQGRQQDPSGLERGDRVRVEVQDDGRRLYARTIEVTHNVRETGGYGGNYGGNPGGAYGGSPYTGTGLEGAVRFVDPRRRVIEISRGGYSGQVEQVVYDQRTRFDYRGEQVSPEQLEPGDIVRIDARRSGSGWIADTVRVTQSARSR